MKKSFQLYYTILRRKIEGKMGKVSSAEFINRVRISLRGYYLDGDEDGEFIPEEDFRKTEIVRMMRDIHDERFLDQIRVLLQLHIRKEGGAA